MNLCDTRRCTGKPRFWVVVAAEASTKLCTLFILVISSTVKFTRLPRDNFEKEKQLSLVYPVTILRRKNNYHWVLFAPKPFAESAVELFKRIKFFSFGRQRIHLIGHFLFILPQANTYHVNSTLFLMLQSPCNCLLPLFKLPLKFLPFSVFYFLSPLPKLYEALLWISELL